MRPMTRVSEKKGIEREAVSAQFCTHAIVWYDLASCTHISRHYLQPSRVGYLYVYNKWGEDVC